MNKLVMPKTVFKCISVGITLLGLPMASYADVQVAESSAVQNCRYMNTVEGSSG